MSTIAFATLGCRVNQYDTDSMRGLFAAAGFRTALFTKTDFAGGNGGFGEFIDPYV